MATPKNVTQFTIAKTTPIGQTESVTVDVASGALSWSHVYGQWTLVIASTFLSWLLVVLDVSILNYYYGYLSVTNPATTSFGWDTLVLLGVAGTLYTTLSFNQYAYNWLGIDQVFGNASGYFQIWILTQSRSIRKFVKVFTTFMVVVTIAMWSYFAWGKQINDLSAMTSALTILAGNVWQSGSTYILPPGAQSGNSASYYAGLVSSR